MWLFRSAVPVLHHEAVAGGINQLGQEENCVLSLFLDYSAVFQVRSIIKTHLVAAKTKAK